jgi:hypothetical protein
MRACIWCIAADSDTGMKCTLPTRCAHACCPTTVTARQEKPSADDRKNGGWLWDIQRAARMTHSGDRAMDQRLQCAAVNLSHGVEQAPLP